jgi:excinuclease ABC subunit A
MEREVISIRGATQHNLRITKLDIPKKKLVVFSGVSGSGKSSLAFDTLYAEGQRRYVESLSSYARQFLGQMDKPAYDKLVGLTPTIAIEQKTASANPRSTVGTITEIHDYLRVLFARVGTQFCPQCNLPVEPLSVDQVVSRLGDMDEPILLLAPVVENRKGELRELVADLRKRGFVRVRHNGEVKRLEDDIKLAKNRKHTLELVVDRLNPAAATDTRLADSVETALREGHGELLALPTGEGEPVRWSQRRACTQCGIGLPELSPQSFSFNSPVGACPACNGLGRHPEMDANLVVPDTSLSVNEGAIEPWRNAISRANGWTRQIFAGLARQYQIDLDRPWRELPATHRHILLYGADEPVVTRYDGDRGKGEFNIPWEGVLNTLMRRFTETKSDSQRRSYMGYFSDAPCSECHGARLRAESRAVRIDGRSLVDLAAVSVAEAAAFFRNLQLDGAAATVAGELLPEIRGRFEFLESVGLGYVTLDRSGPSLSGGEAQRIRLASQLGSELSGVTYVLDEPSIGLHARDIGRLLGTLNDLRDGGNSVIVVEHDAETIRSADWVVDFGPGAGLQGGEVTFSGPPGRLLRSSSLTGQYLSGKKTIQPPARRRRARGQLTVRGARANNLAGIDVSFGLGILTAVTGVSGAGKSSLVTGILYPALSRHLHHSKLVPGAHDGIEGAEQLDKVIRVDQSPIGRTPRSNPVTYTKAFDLIRTLFAQLPEARAFGYKASRFSFNVKGGRCDACQGDGVRRVQMHFLPDVFVPCETCGGKRYNEATLRILFKGYSIADVLAMSVRQARDLFSAHPKLLRILQTLCDVGLDYVKLGQSAPTLSGGEAQRVKLSRELAREDTGRTLYILDEPTTGLHFDDINKLLAVLDRLVDAGNTVVIIEHNLDVVRCADRIIDLGPEGGAGGGRVVAEGTPEKVARAPRSSTGHYLRALLE